MRGIDFGHSGYDAPNSTKGVNVVTLVVSNY